MPEPETPNNELIGILEDVFKRSKDEGEKLRTAERLNRLHSEQDFWRQGWSARDALAQKQQAQLVEALQAVTEYLGPPGNILYSRGGGHTFEEHNLALQVSDALAACEDAIAAAKKDRGHV